MSRWNTRLEEHEVDQKYVKDCVELSRQLRCSEQTDQALLRMVKKTWKRATHYAVSTMDMIVILKCGMEHHPFTFNYVNMKDGRSSTNTLRNKLIPDLLAAHMMTKDTSGRYETYQLNESGFNWLLYSLFGSCDCNLTGKCSNCENKPDDFNCRWCQNSKVCNSCMTKLSYIGFNEFMNLFQTYNS